VQAAHPLLPLRLLRLMVVVVVMNTILCVLVAARGPAAVLRDCRGGWCWRAGLVVLAVPE
jgi:hypothetical protein